MYSLKESRPSIYLHQNKLVELLKTNQHKSTLAGNDCSSKIKRPPAKAASTQYSITSPNTHTHTKQHIHLSSKYPSNNLTKQNHSNVIIIFLTCLCISMLRPQDISQYCRDKNKRQSFVGILFTTHQHPVLPNISSWTSAVWHMLLFITVVFMKDRKSEIMGVCVCVCVRRTSVCVSL